MAGVFCYRNLNRRKSVVWSIRSNLNGRVLSRSSYVVIKDAKLVVGQAGRKRVLKQNRKNVHAGVRGTWVRGDFNQYQYDWRGHTGVYNEDGSRCEWVRISYDPYNNSTFVRQDNGAPITVAETVV